MLGINRLEYYRAQQRSQSKKDLSKEVIELVQSVRVQMPRIGTRKLYHILAEQLKSMKVGRDKLFTILRANGMLIKPKKSYHITTDSHHRFRKHKNKIDQLSINRPEQVWVSDITYVGTRTNPMYLALITDAYSKKIMGYDVSSSLNAQGAIRALKMAIKNRQYPAKSLIHHSDRGLQYCCNEYQQLLDHKAIECSMTESYDPYANAVAERINGILKQEFIGSHKNQTLELMKKIVNQSIDIYQI